MDTTIVFAADTPAATISDRVRRGAVTRYRPICIAAGTQVRIRKGGSEWVICMPGLPDTLCSTSRVRPI